MIKDYRNDWDKIPAAFKELLELQDKAFAKEECAETDDEREKATYERENIPVTIGFGNHYIILPTCAQTVEGLYSFFESLVF